MTFQYCKIKFEGSVWKDVAQECKVSGTQLRIYFRLVITALFLQLPPYPQDLIIQMLDGEPDKRPSAANCLKSAWLCDGGLAGKGLIIYQQHAL